MISLRQFCTCTGLNLRSRCVGTYSARSSNAPMTASHRNRTPSAREENLRDGAFWFYRLSPSRDFPLVQLPQSCPNLNRPAPTVGVSRHSLVVILTGAQVPVPHPRSDDRRDVLSPDLPVHPHFRAAKEGRLRIDLRLPADSSTLDRFAPAARVRHRTAEEQASRRPRAHRGRRPDRLPSPAPGPHKTPRSNLPGEAREHA